MTDVRPMADKARRLPAPQLFSLFSFAQMPEGFEDISNVKGAKHSETQTKMAGRRQAKTCRQTSQQGQAKTAIEGTGKRLEFLEGGKWP